MSKSISLNIKIGDEWKTVLSIPVMNCNHFALRPLKWLHFLDYTIYGSTSDICSHPKVHPVNYEQAIHAGCYYFVSKGTQVHVSIRYLLTHYCKMNLDFWTLTTWMIEP